MVVRFRIPDFRVNAVDDARKFFAPLDEHAFDHIVVAANPEWLGETEAALQIAPDYADAHYQLANALVVLGQVPQAEEHYRRAIEAAPRRAGMHAQLANLLSVSLLAGLAVREIWRGIADRLSRAITVCTALPFVALCLLSLVQAGFVAAVPGWGERLINSPLPGPWRAVLGLLLTVGISLSLIALMIWRLVTRIEHLTHRRCPRQALDLDDAADQALEARVIHVADTDASTFRVRHLTPKRS